MFVDFSDELDCEKDAHETGRHRLFGKQALTAWIAGPGGRVQWPLSSSELSAISSHTTSQIHRQALRGRRRWPTFLALA
jgi:hypothetical protein